ncbi:hypothetical protein SAMN05660199_02497 [Klenkia soli]|uniref:Uncharacterized protein n=1 Tax=Klenkia soli TaxID=1052260 RepID=A0A1H0M270_9ACTN|nr:hypothetical protein [Klenkia soli]SDO74316.1 hypothetical protein SAMN05660199_02497 [Klenkia soli]
MTDPRADAPRPGVPGSVTAATVLVWVGGVLTLLLALLVTAGSQLREAEFGVPGVGWSLVAGVAVHLFLALAGLVALRARHQRWLLVVAAVLGLAGAVVVLTVVGSPTLGWLVAAWSAGVLAAALTPSAGSWVAGAPGS